MPSDESRNRVFVAMIEVKPQPGCELDPDEHEGAFTRAYIPSATFMLALEKLQAALARDCFALIDIDFMADLSAVDWDRPDDTAANLLSEEALMTDDVTYAEFHSYQNASDYLN